MTDLDALRDLYAEKLADVVRHQAGARSVRQYDANNTYQYIINREETELSWIAEAVNGLGGSVDDIKVPVAPASEQGASSHKAVRGAESIEAEDARLAQAFVDRWTPRAGQMNDARHTRMIRVILGEVLEQKRFFEQAREGRTDLLGTRSPAAGDRVGGVLPTRWIE